MRKLMLTGVLATLAVAMAAFVTSPMAVAQSGDLPLSGEQGHLLVLDEPLDDAEMAALGVVPAGGAGTDEVTPMGTDCGGLFNPCGIVNNRTNRGLEAARDSKSHTGCSLWPDSASHPRKFVAAGRNSNQSPEYFKDTDCFRSSQCRVYYLKWHSKGSWIRIWSSVHIYSLGC